MSLKMDIFVKFCIKLRNVKNIKYDKNVKSYNNKKAKNVFTSMNVSVQRNKYRLYAV